MKLRLFADRGFTLNTPALRAAFVAACNVPGITSVMILMKWNEIEPAGGEYMFDTVLGQYTDLIPDGLDLGLGIVPGVFCPDWLTSDLGCKAIPILTRLRRGGDPVTVKYIDPLDLTYFDRQFALLGALRRWLAAKGWLPRLKYLRCIPSSSSDDEACCVAIAADGTRIDAAWADAGWTPSEFTDFWSVFTQAMVQTFPGVTLCLPFMDPDSDFPRVTDAGEVTPHIATGGLVDGLVKASIAAAPGRLAVMQNTLAAAGAAPNWHMWVAMGAQPFAQMNDWAGADGALAAKGDAPSADGFAAVLQAAKSDGVTELELHQVDVLNPAYAGLIAQAAEWS